MATSSFSQALHDPEAGRERAVWCMLFGVAAGSVGCARFHLQSTPISDRRLSQRSPPLLVRLCISQGGIGCPTAAATNPFPADAYRSDWHSDPDPEEMI